MVGRRNRLLPAAALAAVAAATAALVILLAHGSGDSSRAAQLPAAIEARGTLTPQVALFGDTVVARLDVAVDRRRIDPARIRIEGAFSPYRAAGESLRRQRAGSVTYLRYTVTLRCLTSVCRPHGKKRIVFPGATVTYPAPDAGGRTEALRVSWPALDVYSRLDPVELSSVDPRNVAPWRGDPAAVPDVSYGIDPGLLRGLLTAGGVLLLLAAAGLALRRLPRRTPAERRSPAVTLTPLERALLVLESARVRGAAADRRKALELLAAELETGGDPPLAVEARELAWSKATPAGEATKALATRVRRLIKARKNGNGA